MNVDAASASPRFSAARIRRNTARIGARKSIVLPPPRIIGSERHAIVGLQLAEHGADRDRAGLLADLRVIAVRVGLVRDERVDGLDARLRDVAVQVVRDDERRVADHRAHRAHEPRLRIGDAARAHRAVQAQVHAVERGPARAQPLDEPRLERLEAVLRQRAARRRPRRQHRHRLDLGLALARGRDEAGELGALEEARRPRGRRSTARSSASPSR